MKAQETHGHVSILKPAPTPSLTLATTSNARPAHPSTLTPDESTHRVPVPSLSILKPLPVEVSADSIQFAGRSYKISKWIEYSERIANGASNKTHSLQQRSYDRDYYQLEVEGGAQLTIFETPERKFFLYAFDS